MPLVVDRIQVMEIYDEAREKQWVIPTFNAENLVSIEAILSAVHEHGKVLHQPDLPIIVGITNTYSSRPQAINFTQTHQWQVGLQLFLHNLAVLTSNDSPFRNLRVMIHLDHIQWDSDAELLNWDMGQFSSIMYDASTLPLEVNIQKTAAFVEKYHNALVIEGACDEILEARGEKNIILTTPTVAERYHQATGVDIIVPNLGTEHRANKAQLHYDQKLAQQIRDKIGTRLCLHGTSSVSSETIRHLFSDGICKVNIWTALERDSAPALLKEMVTHASKICNRDQVQYLVDKHYLGKLIDTQQEVSIDYFTTTWRQQIVYDQMKNTVLKYLQMFYI